jgi:hypothetical protein
MGFTTESIQAEKAVQTHCMIISAEDNYQLETLTAGMAKFNRPKRRDPLDLPYPNGPFLSDSHLSLVAYLRLMTKRLIEAKQDSQASSCRLEDKDFIADILKHLGPDSPARRNPGCLYWIH